MASVALENWRQNKECPPQISDGYSTLHVLKTNSFSLNMNIIIACIDTNSSLLSMAMK